MNIPKAVLLKLTSALMFSVMSAFVRYVSDVTPLGEVVFCRSFFAIIPVMLIYAWRGELAAAFRTSRPFGHLGRGMISVAGMFFNFAALARLPIVDVTTITFASPLITVALSAWILKERVRVYRWSAVGVGFVGVLDAVAASRRRALYDGSHVGRDARRRVRAGQRLHQCGLGGADAPADRHRDHVLDRALLLVVLHGRRAADAPVRLD